AAVYAKLEAVALRFALLHHVVTEVTAGRNATSNVSRQAMLAGVELARWFAREARRVHAVLRASDESREAMRLAERLEGRGGRITASELFKSSKTAYGSPEGAAAALQGLVDAGVARWEKKEGVGRGTTYCVLLPRDDEDGHEHGRTPKPRNTGTPE